MRIPIILAAVALVERYQWVARDFPRKFFFEPCLGARSRNGLLRSRPFGRAGLLIGQVYFNFRLSAINCRPTRRARQACFTNPLARCIFKMQAVTPGRKRVTT
jgi:hypothetical protein